MRREKAFWDIVSAAGGTVGIVGWYVTWPGFREHYFQEEVVFSDPDVFWTITGMVRRPTGFFVPRP